MSLIIIPIPVRKDSEAVVASLECVVMSLRGFRVHVLIWLWFQTV